MKRITQQWLRIEDDGWQIVIPDFDSKAHSTEKRKKTRELAWLDCPCNPKVDAIGQVIIHNSFIDQKRIEKSLAKIYV